MSVLPMRNASMHHLNIAALLLCTATAGCSMFGKKAPAAPAAASTNVPIDSIAVIVNDDVITRQELAARVKTVAGRMQSQHVPMPEAADLQRQILERMIIERAQLQEAKEMGVRVDDTMLDRAVGRIAEQQKIFFFNDTATTEKEG